MYKWFSFLLLFSTNQLHAGSHTLLKKNFLLSTMLNLENLDHFEANKSLLPHENNFIQKIKFLDFQDILAPTTPSSPDIFAYNALHQKSTEQARIARSFEETSVCSKVFVNSKTKTFYEQSYTSLLKPKGYKKKDGWWSFSYCSLKDKKSDPHTVLYFFHGAAGGAASFKNRKALAEVRDVWREKPTTPIWISISLGRFTSIAEPEKEQQFIEMIVPYLEGKLGLKNPTRYGLGVSLGGANIVHLMLFQPQFFKKTFAVCPAVSSINLPTHHNDLRKYIKRTMAYKSVVRIALSLLPREFKTHYKKHNDPLIAGQKLISEKTPPSFIQASSRDQFGFQEGNRMLAMLLRAHGASVKFEELEGAHCVLRPKSVVHFLQ